jgi:hypothetical protein
MRLEPVGTCAELTMEHAEAAARSAAAMRALLSWVEKTARPGEGAPKVLMAVARLVDAEWLGGTPYVEITGGEEETRLAILVDHGFGMRERVFPAVVMQVPVDEFARAVRLAPHLVAPLVATTRDDVLVLAPPGHTLDEPQEPIPIDSASLNEGDRITTPPHQLMVGSRIAPRDPTAHTHPTVRRMVAVRPEAFRKGGRKDEE